MSARPSANVVPMPRRAKRVHQAARKSIMQALAARVAQLEKVVAQLDRRITIGAFGRRFQVALGGSIVFHLLVIALVTFKMPEKNTIANDKALEVVLVNAKSKARPVKPRAMAQ